MIKPLEELENKIDPKILSDAEKITDEMLSDMNHNTNETKFLYEPDTVSPPGDSLLDILVQLNITQAEFSKLLGYPEKTINGIIDGEEMITPQIAIELERVLGASAEFWNRREAHYRLFLARQKK